MDNSAAATGALSRDATFELLASGHRRAVLRRLDDGEEPVPVPELVAAVVTQEASVEFTPDEHEQVAVSLEHVHLPKLDDAGVIEYDVDAGTVHRREGHELLFEHLYLPDDR